MKSNLILDAMIFVVLLLIILDISQIGATTLCKNCQTEEECNECLQNAAESNIQKRSCGDCRKKWMAYCQSCFIPGKRALPETGRYEDSRRDASSSTSAQNYNRFDFNKKKIYDNDDMCELDTIVRRLPKEWRQEIVDLVMLVSSSFSE